METTPNENNLSPSPPAEEPSIFKDIADTGRLQKQMKAGRVWLYVVAALQTLAAVVQYGLMGDKEAALSVALIDVGVALLFFVLALWSIKKPLIAFIMALVLYVAINLAAVVMKPSNVSSFYVLKIIVMVALARAVGSTVALRKVKESLGE